MLEFARQRGLKRWTIPVPLISPRLSALWLGLVTPVYARVGRRLVESARNPTVVTNHRALDAFRPRGLSEAIERALRNEDQEFAESRWSDAMSSTGRPRIFGGVPFGSRLVDSRTVAVNVPAQDAFVPIRRIGGKTGWYYANWLWKFRGALDLLIGGVGLRRGRRNPEYLAVGETLDCWRVEQLVPDRLLRLSAEMKLPGRAWLEFEVQPETSTTSIIRQTAVFDPIGLWGLVYWYGIWPLHQLVFNGMLQGIAQAARNVRASQIEQELVTKDESAEPLQSPGPARLTL